MAGAGLAAAGLGTRMAPPSAAKVVELRYFGGFTESEAGEALDISVATVKRDWRTARAWLYREMKVGARDGG